MTTIPQSHIADALKLQADGLLHFWELSSLSGGTIYFKSDNDMTWQGRHYETIPCSISGEKVTTDGTPTPRFTLGQEDLDLLPFKGLVFDGALDGATLVRKKVTLTEALADRDVKRQQTFRVKKVESYGRSQIVLSLASFSAATSQTIPFRQYIPPAFPWVTV